MSTNPSKYGENQALNATEGRNGLMSELMADTLPRATALVGGVMEFGGVLGDLDATNATWITRENALANAEAALPGLTYAFQDKLDAINRKPDAENNSPIETWDNTIRGAVPYQGPVYMNLLPQGRSGLTTGSHDNRLDALRTLGERLALQTDKPTLVALAATVTAYYTSALGKKNAQTAGKAALETARVNIETTRKAAAADIYALLGQGMVYWKNEPERVDTLWDVNILRRSVQNVPAAPGDTTWTPGTRTLSTTAMPDGATRLEAWRTAPGGMPELLLTGGFGQTELIIPATITFPPDGLYQLWLHGVNSRGHSEPGPIQSWTPT